MKNLLSDIPIRRLFLLLVLLLITTAAGSPAETDAPRTPSAPVTLKARLSPEEATIGDRIAYSLTLTRAHKVLMELPEPPRSIDGVTLLKVEKKAPKKEGDRIVESRSYLYRVDRTGTIVFPALKGTCLSDGKEITVATRALTLTVRSLLPAKMKDIHEIKPLEPAGFYLPIPFLIAAGLLLLALLVVVFLRQRRKKRADLPFVEAVRSPREEAEEALNKLAASGLIEKGEFKKYCFRLSEIFRRYLERRFRFPAVESTSEEIRHNLNTLPAEEKLKEEVRLFLRNTDRVKYAGHQAEREEIDGETERVRTFVALTSQEGTSEKEAEHVAF
ncbi:MAG: hypothetical protein GXP58_07155 [Deltaproteobacteria bacterium]|nr:hypothetical protein [Deltaproteobacteria bacterium]